MEEERRNTCLTRAQAKANKAGEGRIWNTCLTQAQEGFAESKRFMVRHHPFYASFLLSLEVVWNNSCPIAATDGEKFFFNPIRTKDLTLKQWNFLICHECFHVAHMHPFRREARHPVVWNIAADYVANELIQRENDFELLPNILIDDKYFGMSPEQIYTLLMKKAKQVQMKMGGGSSGGVGDGDGGASGTMIDPGSPDGAGGGGGKGQGAGGTDEKTQGDGDKGPGQGDNKGGGGYSPDGEGDYTVLLDIDWTHGDVLDHAEMDEHAVTEAKNRAKAITYQAAYYARAMGQDNELSNQVIESNAPKPSWSMQIQNFVSNVLEKDDYTWARCNRRYVPQGVYLPTLGGSKPPKLMGIAIDTSGSIDTDQLKAFAEELSGMVASHPNLSFLTYFVNTKIQKKERLSVADIPIKMEARGGGGTKFRPAFDDIEKEGEPVAGLIYFTDLECDDYGPEPDFPVVWLNFGRPQKVGSPDHYDTWRLPPWGDVVNMAT